MPQPSWLAHAWADLGQREGAGERDNPRIMQYYRDVGFADVHHDEVAWCAAFVGACLERAGIPSTRLLLARSYLQHGAALSGGRPGAIAVLSRGNDPALGHVGFWLGETTTQVILLGGNQADAVSVAAFDKSRLLALRWPGMTQAIAVAAPSQSDLFERALAHVLEMEGGWTEDPYDPGGPTNKGITLATFAAWRGVVLDSSTSAGLKAELRAIDVAAVRAIYHARYWSPSHAAGLPPALALIHFDASVNHGVGSAARMLQEAVGVEVDGEIGPLTLAAAVRGDASQTIAAYAEIRRRRYRTLPHLWRFGRGWLNRVAATEKLALRLRAEGMQSTSQTMKGNTTMSDVTSQVPAPSKWWAQSMTMWGVIVTTLSTVLPIVGPFIGLPVSAEMVRQIGAEATSVIQALGGLIGTLLTIYGRVRADLPLSLREMRMKL